MTSPPIDTLTDQQAITVLALVLDRDRRLPDPAALREIDAQVAAAARTGIDGDETSEWAVPEAADGEATPGALARATLAYLSTEQPDAGPVIDRAIAMTMQGVGTPSRLDPVTIGVGALVVLALQTDLQLERKDGKWRFKIRKKAMSDSTLGTLLGKLIAAYTGNAGP
jgi:hypothetical protein